MLALFFEDLLPWFGLGFALWFALVAWIAVVLIRWMDDRSQHMKLAEREIEVAAREKALAEREKAVAEREERMATSQRQP